MSVPERIRVERVLVFAFPRRLGGRESFSSISGDLALFLRLRRVTGSSFASSIIDFSGSHIQSVRSVNSKPNRCSKYPRMLPALGQFAPTATPAPKARSPLKATFRLGITGAFQTVEKKATRV